MRIHGAIGLFVAVFAISLPAMYLMKNGEAAKWLAPDATSEGEEEKDDPVVDALCLKGLMYLGDGQHDKAITAYSEAIKRDPKYSFSYLGRGDAYVAKGDLNRALQDYDCAARLDPANNAAKERANLVRTQQRQK